MNFVNIIIGLVNYHKLTELIKTESGVKLDFLVEEKFKTFPSTRKITGVTDYIAVLEGYNKFCSYCIVPYTRGREYSRDYNQILNEAKILRDNGVKEITLLGQNVDNYYFNNKDLADIIFDISQIDGIERIRYMASYPS